MDLTEVIKHLRDEATSHRQQAEQVDRQRLDHLRMASELDLHARQLEIVAAGAGPDGETADPAGTRLTDVAPVAG